MKIQYKIINIVGLILFMTFNLFGQIPETSMTLDSTKHIEVFAKGEGEEAIPSDPFNIGTLGENFVAMPSPNSLTIVNQIESGVDMYTGKVKTSVPITSLSSYDISVPVGLSYASNGIKVNEIGSWVGTGWNLQAGGKITRVMHNLPDEFEGELNNYDSGRLWDGDIEGYGYLRIKTDPVVDGNSFPVLLDQMDFDGPAILGGSQTERNDRQTVIKLANWQSCEDCEIALDTEPDEFYFSFGNYSGKFVFDQDGGIHTIPQTNLEITPHFENVSQNIGSSSITSFEVKTPQGMIYTFGSTGTSLAGVETSKVLQTSMSSRFQYNYLGECMMPGEQIFDPPVPCEETAYLYEVAPVLHKIGYEIAYGPFWNDFNINWIDFPPNGNNPSVPDIKNAVSKRLGYFSSTWHLKSISSPSGDLVVFGYEDESYRFAQSRGYSWNRPDIELTPGLVDNEWQCVFQSSHEPIETGLVYEPDSIYPSLATLTHTVVEVAVQGKRLVSILGANNRSLEFVPTDNDRPDLYGAKALSEIEYKIGGVRKKSWALGYDDIVSLSSNTPQWIPFGSGAVKLATEDVLDLMYELVNGPKYMSSFRHYCQVKHKYWQLWDPNNDTGTTIDEYYQQEYEDVWKPEHNRSYLNLITEIGKNSESIDLVEFDYNDSESLPKRFFYKQDRYGFFNNNSRSTLLPRHVSLVQQCGDSRTFPHDDIQTAGEEHLGHYDNPDWTKAETGLLKSLIFHTGASKEFTYENNGYGVRLQNIMVDPGGTPVYNEFFEYANGSWVTGFDNVTKIYDDLEMNHIDNQLVMNSYDLKSPHWTKGSLKGYGTVRKYIKDNASNHLGYSEHTFYTPADFANSKPTMRWVFDTNDALVTDYSFPYAPYKDYDYKRGIPKRVTINGAQGKVSETIYDWDIFGEAGATIVPGLKTVTVQRYEEDPDLNWIAHRADYYRFISDRFNLLSTTQINYENGDESNPLTVVTNHSYHSNNDLWTKSIQNSDGLSYTTEYLRVSDIPGYESLYPSMVARNMQSNIWATKQLIGGNQVSGSKVDYKTNWTNCAGCILPWKNYSYENGWELKSTTTSVNSHGQPLRIEREHYNDPHIFTWESDGLLDSKSYGSWTWDYDYDSDRLLSSVTDVDLQVNNYGYDGFGKLNLITERGGARSTEITYEYAGLNGGGENSVRKITTADDVSFIPPTIETFDGLGRTLTTTKEGYTPYGGDFVTSSQYDAFGRITSSTDPSTGATKLYNYENSPQNRVIEESYGSSSSSIYIKYGFNTAQDAVSGYNVNSLFKTTSIDENGYPSETFTDKIGQTVLLRKKVDNQNVDTYYDYDNKGLLREIIQPNGESFSYEYYQDRKLLSKTIPGGGTIEYAYNDKDQLWTETDANGNTLTYSYNKYDQPKRTLLDGSVISNNTYYGSGLGNKGRLHQTFVSGINTGGIFTTSMLYDGFGRVIEEEREHPTANDKYVYTYDQRDLTQTIDRTHDESLNILKTLSYDDGGRLISGDISIDGSPTERLFYNTYNGQDWLTEKNLGGTPDGTPLQSIDYKYNSRGWLTHINDVGECTGIGPQGPQSPQDDQMFLKNKGMVELSFNAGEIIQNSSTNISMDYNMDMSFEGELIFNVNNIMNINIGGIVDATGTEYTHTRAYTLEGEFDEETLATIMTEDIRLDAENQKPGSTLSDSRKEDIRNGIKNGLRDNPKDKDCLNVEGDLFAQQIYYDNVAVIPELNNQRQFNGNISLMKWRVMVPGRDYVDYYGYEYDGIYDATDIGLNSSNDGLRQLENANYAQRTLQMSTDGSFALINIGRYDVGLTYADGNGNIGSINRNGVIDDTNGNFTFGVTDNLLFGYQAGNANRLASVGESENIDHGFTAAQKIYGHDANGNINSVFIDGVETSFTYNHLNLPNVIATPDGDITYHYDASGRKLTKIGEDGTRQYVDGIEYNEGEVESIFNEEGRYLVAEQKFEYVLKDHLGNSRVMFTDVNDDDVIDPAEDADEVIQENHYYPFGMDMEGEWTNSVGPYNNYLFNGKELNSDFDLNWNDYGARFYDASIGRWNAVDPLAEEFKSASSFTYVLNNPIRLIDPNGMFATEPDDWFRNIDTGNFTYFEGKTQNDIIPGYTYWGISPPYNPSFNDPSVKDWGFVGNDNVGNAVTAVELIAKDKNKKILEGMAEGIGNTLDGLEAVKIVYEGYTATDEAAKTKAKQDGAKLATEVGLGLTVGSGIGIPANVLINNSRNPESVAHPENIDRAAGAFEISKNAVSGMAQSRIRANQEQRIRFDSMLAKRSRNMYYNSTLKRWIPK